MTGNAVNGSGNGARSGASTLKLLSGHRNCLLLRSLEDGPRPQADLRRVAGIPAQSTLRSDLRSLEDIGAVAGRRRNRFPGTVEYELEEPGRELLFVLATLERWIAQAPGGLPEIAGGGARAAIRALAEGWSSTMLRALAARPLSLTELDNLIGALNYPALERRLTAMRLTGLVEAADDTSRGTPYAVTAWMRRAAAPLIAAMGWERRNSPTRHAPIAGIDAEAVFLLAVPMLALQPDLAGTCRLAMELSNGGNPCLAGVVASARDGSIASCTTKGKATAWATGTVATWFRALIDADTSQLETGGDAALACALVRGLHDALFLRDPSAGSKQRNLASLNLTLDVPHQIGEDRAN